jgi:glucose/arabinose dehydrogenase
MFRGLLVMAIALMPCVTYAQPTLPPEFQAIQITPALNDPVAMAFAPDGRLFVAERAGAVKVIQNNTVVSTFIDLTDEVNAAAFSDRGLLGLALDPGFAINRRVYLFYSVDPVLGEPDEPGETATFSRLVRYQGTLVSNGNVADPASRTVLIGAQPNLGVPQCWRSHGAGALRFAPDGTLLAGHGESAQFAVVDAGGLTPECFEPPLFNSQQDIGAFRAQMINSMGGKILRIDPETGHGVPSNPYWLGDPEAPRARIWLSGLRNPFRFAIRPGTGSSTHPGTIFIGDVGWSTFEEISVAVAGGENFGWPCREGFAVTKGYPDVDLQQWDCKSIGSQANPGPLTEPLISYHHFNDGLSNPPGVSGVCVTGGVFHVGDNYPSPYRGAYFFADCVIGWIKVMRVDAANKFLGRHDLAEGANGPVDFAIDPLTGEVCFVSLFDGVVYRLHSLIGPGDVNRDGMVDVDDLVAIILAWGPCDDPVTCPEDLNVSGQVDVDDLVEVILNWG